MTQTKTGASRFGGRLFKSAATSALALSAVAGGVMLSGGEAKAVEICDKPPTPPFDKPVCVDGDWTNTYVGFSYNAAPSQEWTIDMSDLMVSPDQAQVDVDFDLPTNAGEDGFYKYFIKTADHNIIRAQLDADDGGIGAEYDVWKYIYTADKGTLIDVLYVTEGTGPDLSIAFNEPELYIEDYWKSYAQGTINIDNFVNAYQTPGPLPIVGAGAAFGFSRKLRSRIKASRSA